MFDMNLAAGIESIATLSAYLDPGSGSMILQVAIAGLLSSLFFLKSSFTFLKSKLAGIRDLR